MLSVCTGAFVLGQAGLLDGRACTTHWMHTDELAERFPRAEVRPGVLYVDEGTVVTSAGSAAGLDACLHLWREDHGAAVASAVARRMVVPPQRDGGQAQFIRSAVPSCDEETLGGLLVWMLEHLDEPLTVTSLARTASMSERTFARRFRAETGTTPHAWLTLQRVIRAEELLETTDLSVERVADAVGFGGAAALRHHFTRVRGLSPQQYRRQFTPPGRRAELVAPDLAGPRHRQGVPAPRSPWAAWPARAARAPRRAGASGSASPTTAAHTRSPHCGSGTP